MASAPVPAVAQADNGDGRHGSSGRQFGSTGWVVSDSLPIPDDIRCPIMFGLSPNRMRRPPPCRLALVIAAEAPIAVILRRGPTRWVEVVRWNTADDTFEYGQWFHGRIYEERCGLSPDGALFVYAARQHGRIDEASGYLASFTAVSKPPYLTALAMWPADSTWGGGGRFTGLRTLRLAYALGGTSHPGVAPTNIYMAPLPDPHPRHLPIGLEIETDLDDYAPYSGRLLGTEPDGSIRVRDAGGREIVVRNGAIYVVEHTGTERLLRDFNSDTRRDVPPPPEATTW